MNMKKWIKGKKKRMYVCQFCKKSFYPWGNTDNKFCSYSCSGRGRRSGSLLKDGNKKCCRCLETKSINEFFNGGNDLDGYHPRCKRCDLAVKIKSKYNLSLEDYDKLMVACEICGSKRNLHIDHDHGTGELRGCLCINCNTALGGFRDNPELLEKAIKYLSKYYRY